MKLHERIRYEPMTERKLLKLNIDAGGVQARRVIDRLIAAEQAPQA